MPAGGPMFRDAGVPGAQRAAQRHAAAGERQDVPAAAPLGHTGAWDRVLHFDIDTFGKPLNNQTYQRVGLTLG